MTLSARGQGHLADCTLRRVASILAMCCLLVVPGTVQSADGAAVATPEPRTLDCRAGDGDAAMHWRVELLAEPLRARLDGRDVAAEFGNGHVRLRVAADGTTLFIGLVSGRMVISNAAGKTIGAGRCVGPTAV